MNKKIIESLFQEYLHELYKQITTDDFFHVDVTVRNAHIEYRLTSTLYAESTGEPIFYDYDSERESPKPNIITEFYSLVAFDQDGDQVGWYDNECYDIIKSAIEQYKR